MARGKYSQFVELNEKKGPIQMNTSSFLLEARANKRSPPAVTTTATTRGHRLINNVALSVAAHTRVT